MPSLAASRASMWSPPGRRRSPAGPFALSTPTSASDAASRRARRRAARSRPRRTGYWMNDHRQLAATDQCGELLALGHGAARAVQRQRQQLLGLRQRGQCLLQARRVAFDDRASSPRITSVDEICTGSNCIACAGRPGSSSPSRQANSAMRVDRIVSRRRSCVSLCAATIARGAGRCYLGRAGPVVWGRSAGSGGPRSFTGNLVTPAIG